MSQMNCSHCGALNDDVAVFCGGCGKSPGAAKRPALSDPNATSKLIEIVTATMRNADVSERNTLCDQFFQMRSDYADSCVAWAMRLYCFVQLRQINEIDNCRHNALQDYALYLGLTEEQRSQFLADPGAIHPLSFDENLKLKKHIEDPHLLTLFDELEFHTSTESFMGNSATEKAENALESWKRGLQPNDANEVKFCGLLAFLYLKLGYHEYAAQVLETLVSKEGFSERLGSPRYTLFWGNALAGNAYDVAGKTTLAILKWHKVRTYELMREKIGFFDVIGSYWVGQARKSLKEQGQKVPTVEESQIAQTHLYRAWQWDDRANSEIDGMGLLEWATLLKDHGDDFKYFVSESAKELGAADNFDPFAICKVAEDDEGDSAWVSVSNMKAALFHKRGLVYLAVDDFDSSIREFQQSLSIESSLQSSVYLGFALDGKGIKNEAREIYMRCIHQTDRIAGRYESAEFREGMRELAQIFMNEL